MKATDFENRHQRWIHLVLVGAAFSTYFFDGVDSVWAMVEHQPNARALERMLFAVATVLVGCGAALRTSASRLRSPSKMHLGSVLYALGIGSLAPLPGFAILAIGETVLATRLYLRELNSGCEQRAGETMRSWASAVRTEAVKWGLFLTMIVFTAVLIDRVADVLAAASLAIAAALNWRSYCRTA